MAVYFELEGTAYKVDESTMEDLELIANKIAENISKGVAVAYKVDDIRFRVLNFAGCSDARVVYADSDGTRRKIRSITKRELGINSVATPYA